MSIPDRRQQLVAFFSADMARATEFKNRHQAHYRGDSFIPARWPRYFSEVFNRIIRKFDEELRSQQLELPTLALTRPRLWKINGDELLFRALVLPGEIGMVWLAAVARAFVNTIQTIDSEILADGCGLRGCMWTAGFPIRNSEIRVPTHQGVPVIKMDGWADEPDFETGLVYPSEEGFVDYLGPDMDLGFRLAGVTPPGRTTCSLDVAYFLTDRSNSPSIHHVGWRSLKGVGGGAPYPMLWMSTSPLRQPRHPWEDGADDSELAAYLTRDPMRRPQITELAESYWEQLPEYFIKPYTDPSGRPAEHVEIWRVINEGSDLDSIIIIDPVG